MRKQENEEEEDAIKEGDSTGTRGGKKFNYLFIPPEGTDHQQPECNQWLANNTRNGCRSQKKKKTHTFKHDKKC